MKTNRHIIYGLRPVIEAITAGKEIDKIILQQGLKGDLYKELIDLAKQCEYPIQKVPVEKLNKLSNNQNHQGVVAFLASVSYANLENVVPSIYEDGKTPLILILDRITDVRNFGAIVRTAECCGVDAIVIPAQGAAQINEDAVKTSAGAIHKMAICRSQNIKTTIHFLKASGLKVMAASEKAKQIYTKADFSAPLAIILGSEEDGVSPEYMKLCDELIAIPLFGEIGSLNVSVACGVILYEAIRQRTTMH